MSSVLIIIFLFLFLILSLWLWALSSIVGDLRDKVNVLGNETEALYKLIWRYMGISESPSLSKSCSLSPSPEPPSPSPEPKDDPWETNDSNDSYESGDDSYFDNFFTACPYCKARNKKENMTCSSCGGNL